MEKLEQMMLEDKQQERSIPIKFWAYLKESKEAEEENTTFGAALPWLILRRPTNQRNAVPVKIKIWARVSGSRGVIEHPQK